MTTKSEVLAQIARDNLAIETLETRNSDTLDFHDLSVARIRAALDAAYEAGRARSASVFRMWCAVGGEVGRNNS